MEFDGKLSAVNGHEVVLSVTDERIIESLKQFDLTVEQPEMVVKLIDERQLSPQQRRKTYALLKDIADWLGYDVDDLKQTMKGLFYVAFGIEPFSLANTDMTTARMFISFLIEFALDEGIPMSQSLKDRTDDLEVYMLQAMRHRSCVICGQHADIHHIDAIGMGNDRTTTDHRGREMIALCREHHQLAHSMGWPSFSQLFHVQGAIPSSEMIQQLGLMTQKRMNEIDE